MKKLLSLQEASIFASEFMGKDINQSNINYLLQYGIIKKIKKLNKIYISKEEIEAYYLQLKEKENEYKKELGKDINWHLSFDKLKEKDTTKHIHRLHPYKGKFIPQLAEYFLDSKTDEFKKTPFFKKGDLILDPFCGSGTTLIVANELQINAIGVDISEFNSFMTNVKLINYDEFSLINDIEFIKSSIKINEKVLLFEKEVSSKLSEFNKIYFNSPEYKIKVRNKEINEKDYSIEKEKEFNKIYKNLQIKFNLDNLENNLQNENNSFLNKWYCDSIKEEMKTILELIEKIKNNENKNLLKLILSRTLRSVRATTHSDLGTLKEPTKTPYYCKKHFKMCKPLLTMIKRFINYANDTLTRILEFKNIKDNESKQICLTGNSQIIDLEEELKSNFKNKKIKGIFSSPPYLGLINYHQQHSYAYELFDIKRRDKLEIGSLDFGTSKLAQENYIDSISNVLKNMRKYMELDFDVFLVANDKYDLYWKIAKKSNMKIVNKFKRPVLNRVEKNRLKYSETVFHFRGL